MRLAIQQHIEDNDGYCLKCKKWTAFGGVEPDARKYECEECGTRSVYGAEELLFMGNPVVYQSEDEEEDE